jgi:hypothetical protein
MRGKERKKQTKKKDNICRNETKYHCYKKQFLFLTLHGISFPYPISSFTLLICPFIWQGVIVGPKEEEGEEVTGCKNLRNKNVYNTVCLKL